MNKKLIQEMASQCWLQPSGGTFSVSEFDYEKFAELILHECFSTLRELKDGIDEMHSTGVVEAIYKLRERFDASTIDRNVVQVRYDSDFN